jgi:hypothetical protein
MMDEGLNKDSGYRYYMPLRISQKRIKMHAGYKMHKSLKLETTVVKGKGKREEVFPVQAMKAYGGAEVQFHSFLTTALNGDEWLTPRPVRFTPRERTTIPIPQHAGWAAELVWVFWRREKSLPTGFAPRTAQLVA